MTPAAHHRSRARSWALQVLYAWEVAGEDRSLLDFARTTFRRRRVSERYRPYLERLLNDLEAHLPEVDGRLDRGMPNWRLERLAAVDRNILRIGVVELLHADDVPPRVAISEAIRLAEKYGSEESPRFVNGVLDGVWRRTRGDA